jgi:hypothetical protein
LTKDSGPLADFLQEANRILAAAREKGIQLRLMGACAIRIHCLTFGELHDALQRPLSDLDFVSYLKFNTDLKNLLIQLGYTPRVGAALLTSAGKLRQIYYDEMNRRVIDIFFDRLAMCHVINFKGRLELDYPTIPLADILLEKMQIVEINDKDLKDSVVLLREHEIGEVEKETVNAKYIAELLSNDWGFYFTVTTNLNKLKDALARFGNLTEKDRADVQGKITKLLAIIEKQPKSFGWKMRARIGTSKKWYTDVEEVSR